jgi:hypothetical protein
LVESEEVETQDDKPAARLANEHLDTIAVSVAWNEYRGFSRLNDWLLEGARLSMLAFAVSHTLLVLIFGQDGVRTAREEHHGHQEGDDCFKRHVVCLQFGERRGQGNATKIMVRAQQSRMVMEFSEKKQRTIGPKIKTAVRRRWSCASGAAEVE